jgi:hypothetical protein
MFFVFFRVSRAEIEQLSRLDSKKSIPINQNSFSVDRLNSHVGERIIGNEALRHEFAYFRTRCTAIAYEDFAEKANDSSTVGVNGAAAIRSIEQGGI